MTRAWTCDATRPHAGEARGHAAGLSHTDTPAAAHRHFDVSAFFFWRRFPAGPHMEKIAAKKKAGGDPPSQAELKKMQAAKDRLEAKSTKVAARPGSHREKLEKDPELYKEVEAAAVKKGKRTVDGFLKGVEEEREEREKSGWKTQAQRIKENPALYKALEKEVT